MGIERCVVLGGGGATAIAWELGVADGLGAAGVELRAADRIIGTSAGAVAAAKLTLGESLFPREELRVWGSTPQEPQARMSVRAAVRLFLAQLARDRRRAVVWLGERAMAGWSSEAEAAWIDYVAGDLAGLAWPERLVVVAVDALTARPVAWTAASGVPLERAVAASCSLPGIFPPVRVGGEGRPYIDGGMRSPANIDLAGDARRVIALAPGLGSAQQWRRPERQAAALSGQVCFVIPDLAARAAAGPDALDTRRAGAVFKAGRTQGLARGAEARGVWGC